MIGGVGLATMMWREAWRRTADHQPIRVGRAHDFVKLERHHCCDKYWQPASFEYYHMFDQAWRERDRPTVYL